MSTPFYFYDPSVKEDIKVSKLGFDLCDLRYCWKQGLQILVLAYRAQWIYADALHRNGVGQNWCANWDVSDVTIYFSGIPFTPLILQHTIKRSHFNAHMYVMMRCPHNWAICIYILFFTQCYITKMYKSIHLCEHMNMRKMWGMWNIFFTRGIFTIDQRPLATNVSQDSYPDPC